MLIISKENKDNFGWCELKLISTLKTFRTTISIPKRFDNILSILGIDKFFNKDLSVDEINYIEMLLLKNYRIVSHETINVDRILFDNKLSEICLALNRCTN